MKDLFEGPFTLSDHTATEWSFDLGTGAGVRHVSLIGTGLGTEGAYPKTGTVTGVSVTLADGTVKSYGDLTLPAIAVSKGLHLLGDDHAGRDLKGGDGRDDLTGGSGDDHIHGGRGSDHLHGGGGHDDLDGGTGDDSLDGGLGDDDLAGGAGNDSLDGGVGIDTAHFDDAAKGISVDLGTGRASGDGADTLKNIENVAGSHHGDRLTGNAGHNDLHGGDGNDTEAGGKGDDRLHGDAGNDVLTGGDGGDRLEGGTGKDMLTGGSGDDTFVFAHSSSDGIDRITDFRHGQDTIELDHTGFAGLAAGALDADAFFLGSVAHDADDRILYDAKSGALSYDADGSGDAAAVQFAILKPHLKLTADDFHIV
ncbi:calcium-binding protein [Methylobacterium sp. Leaf456]|uniref:calcium-binding protein n=1 Tax=Methylobacterium sp. Leaf456 TaxID=1736382 RepID=UPI001910338E|nr:calcium-binding protein [Methylobacterium sp. Leaf456]